MQSGVTQRVGGILKGWDEPEHAATLLPPIHHLPPCPCTHCQRETNAAAADAEGEVGRAVKETSTKAECNSMVSIGRVSCAQPMLLGE